MPLLDQKSWYILKHLHHNVATQAAARIDAGERTGHQAHLVSAPINVDGQVQMNVAEIAAEFIASLLAQPEGEQLVAKYLADALQEGSPIQQQIASAYGFAASYTLSVQEALLPNGDGGTRPALMVLVHGRGFALPIFHTIEVLADGGRRCQLRGFPEIEEIEAVQHMLQARMQQGPTTLH